MVVLISAISLRNKILLVSYFPKYSQFKYLPLGSSYHNSPNAIDRETDERIPLDNESIYFNRAFQNWGNNHKMSVGTH